jgi:hypothetical protein
VDAVISQLVAEAATASAGKVLGSSASTLAGRRRAHVVRRSVQDLAEQHAGAVGEVLEDLDKSYADRVIQYVGSADFEQLAIQLTGMALERRRPEKYVQDLRESLARSLCLHEAVPSSAAESLADRLFDELWTAVAQYVSEAGNTPGSASCPGLR